MKMEVATTSQKTSSTFGRGKKKSSSTALAVVTATGCSYFSVQLLNYMPHVVEGAQLGKTKKKSLLAMNKQGVAQKSREAKKNQKTKKNLRAQTSKETLRPISSGSVPAAAPWTNLITTATAAPLTNICMNANYMSSGSIDEIEIQIQIILLCISILFPGRLWSSDWTIARITTSLPGGSVCTHEHKPVKCSDGKTYGNSCKAENAGYKNCDPVDEVEKRPPSGCPRLLKPVLCYDKEYQDNGDGPPENYLFDNLCLAENDGFDDSDCEEIDPAEFTPPPPGETTSCSTVYPECSKEVPSDMPFEHFLKQCELACFGDYPTASYPPFFEDPLEMIEEKLASLEEKIDTLATQKSDITGAVFQNVKTGTGWFRGQETPRETPETMGPPPPPTPMPLRR